MSEIIATVTTTFAPTGKIKSATLKPIFKNILANEELINYVNGLVATDTPPIRARLMGQSLLAKLFNKITGIELADPDKYYIDSEMAACEKYRDGKTKKCTINFLFKER